MKKLLTLAFFFYLTSSFGQLTFNKEIGSPTSNEATFDMLKLPNAYILTGYRTDLLTNDDMLLIKLDLNGNTIWSKRYGGVRNERAYSVTRSIDNGYVMCGYSKSFAVAGTDSFNVCITKVDSNGVLLWSKIIGGNNAENAFNIKTTLSGGFVMCGYTKSFSSGLREDILVLRTDANGNLQWSKSFGTNGADTAYSITETNSGDFILAGCSNSATATNSSIIQVSKLGANGNLKWVKHYFNTIPSCTAVEYWRTRCIIQDNSDKYVICGSHACASSVLGIPTPASPFVVKLDTSGAVNWFHEYLLNSANCVTSSIKQTSDNGYIFSSTTNRATLVKINSLGITQWTKCYDASFGNTSYRSIMNSAFEANDLGFIASGITISANDTSSFLLKTPTNGTITNCNTCNVFGNAAVSGYTNTTISLINPIINVTSPIQFNGSFTQNTIVLPETISCSNTANIKEQSLSQEIKVSPNPFVDEAKLIISDLKSKPFSLLIYAANGALIKTIESNSSNELYIKRDNLLSGFYFYKVKTQQEILGLGKLVITD